MGNMNYQQVEIIKSIIVRAVNSAVSALIAKSFKEKDYNRVMVIGALSIALNAAIEKFFEDYFKNNS